MILECFFRRYIGLSLIWWTNVITKVLANLIQRQGRIYTCLLYTLNLLLNVKVIMSLQFSWVLDLLSVLMNIKIIDRAYSSLISHDIKVFRIDSLRIVLSLVTKRLIFIIWKKSILRFKIFRSKSFVINVGQ